MARALALNTMVCLLWLLAVGAGLVVVSRVETRLEGSSITPGHWPSEAPISLSPDAHTLVMFAHPHCPCTAASIRELERLVTKCHNRLTAHIFFFSPANAPGEWTMTDLWKSASALPGVRLHTDADGMIARQFGADTSGQVFVYDARGELAFSGGITSESGKAGRNLSTETLIHTLLTHPASTAQTQVQGCPLLPAYAAASPSGT